MIAEVKVRLKPNQMNERRRLANEKRLTLYKEIAAFP